MLQELVSLFPPNVRSRGEQYVLQQRIRIARADAQVITALVRGSTEYAVEVTASPGKIIIECTCPYAADRATCKHGWAVLRYAELTRKLGALINTAGPSASVVGRWAQDVDDDDVELDPVLDGLVPRRTKLPRPPKPPPPPEWKQLLGRVQQHAPSAVPVEPQTPQRWPEDRRIVYVIDLDATSHADGLVVNLATEKRRKDGSWDEMKAHALGANIWFANPDPMDRQIAQMLLGTTTPSFMYGGVRTSGFVVSPRAFDTTLRLICETGRARLLVHGHLAHDAPQWDGAAPWQFRLRIVRDGGGGLGLSGVLEREGEELSLSQPILVHRAGFLVTSTSIARFDHGNAFPLASELRAKQPVPIEQGDLAEVLDAVSHLPGAPPIDVPPDTGIHVAEEDPVPIASLGGDPEPWRARGPMMSISIRFRYGRVRVDADSSGGTVFDRDASLVHRRRRDLEAAATAKLLGLGAREEHNYGTRLKRLVVPVSRVSSLVIQLLRSGWDVDAAGVPYRAPGEKRAAVRSGIDWFDLDAAVSYGDVDMPLPALLDAHRRGDDVIALPDGSLGILPLDWLRRLGAVAAGGESTNGVTRFKKSQAALLDALLAALPHVDVDATFDRARTELRKFDQVEPSDAPATFSGTLREYQREGLGWLHFLRRFGLGGCLADDMGLGKTVQVLALLEARRLDAAGPSIVVVPRSLVFNWIREAQRFAPALRVDDWSGARRDITTLVPGAVDVVLTTYGALRRDAPALSSIEFEYAILDEAQAIKNQGTATAKAARLLRARHRLAMSGTPIENRIDELWSLFEFLNPGMLGTTSHFAALARIASEVPADGARTRKELGGRELLARALRPVILRRTKEKVATELPPRVEQTLEVELEGAQRKFYDGVREEYRRSVLARVDRDGIERSRMHILEALLRLRQAACHPVLADSRKTALPSAKLDALLPALAEVVAEGHKALVFSQFTGFLALVRERLEKSGITYEYLDGKVRDREARVDRFQDDPACPVFLISLKAGGHGLNLTAGDYVFILDPWWNPAVEAQAIDRTHRIGQTRHVIATRFVARGTIEEKMLELQATKRSLAEAILTADEGVLRSIGRAELELLLG
jgi:superfamily II DNA or RNA helicase